MRKRPYTVGLGLLLLVFSVGFLGRDEPEWESVFLRAAAQLWRGEDIYARGSAYLYPPFMAWAHLPFLPLPALLKRVAWLGVNVLCLTALLRWGWRLAGGGRLQGSASVPWQEHAAALAGFLCGIVHIQNCLAHRQVDVVIAWTVAGGCLLLQRGHSGTGAAAFGVAAASKCTPLLWCPYLLWRGRFAAALWLVCVAVGVNLAADLVHASPTGQPWLVEFGQRWLRPLAAPTHEVGTWGSDVVYNQSLAGAGQRWLTTTLTWAAHDCEVHPRPQRPSPAVLRWVVYGVELGLVLLILLACGRPFRSNRPASDAARHGLECGIVVALMLLLSPMSSKAHFGILVIPAFCLGRAALRLRSTTLWALLALAVVLGITSTKDPLGERLYTLFLWCGATTWQTLALLAGCVLGVRWTDAAERVQVQRPQTEGLAAAA
jgi:hypothetical protein